MLLKLAQFFFLNPIFLSSLITSPLSWAQSGQGGKESQVQGGASEATGVTQMPAQEPLKAERRAPWGANYFYMQRDFSGAPTGALMFEPTGLEVAVHHFALSYNWSENFSISVSTQYVKNEITLASNIPRPGAPAKMVMSTEGLSDSWVGVNRQWKGSHGLPGNFVFSTHLSLPTGSYQEKTESGRLVSYPGQLGSGTVDWVPSLTHRLREGAWELNSRAEARIRMGRNNLGYRLGDELSASLTGGFWLHRYLALTLGGSWRAWGDVKGSENVDRFNAQVSRSGSTSGSRPPMGEPADGRPPAGAEGPASPPLVRPASGAISTQDIFAAAGTRLSAQVGLKSGIYLGPAFLASVEVGAPVYVQQMGPLKGLEPTWFLMTHLRSQF